MTIDTISPVQEREISGLRSVLKKCFSFPVLMGVILVGANFTVERGLCLDPDTWWHLKYGATILQTGHWPTVDTWSFTVHGMPRVAYEWGGEVLTALAYRLGGLRGLDVLLIALTSTIVILLYYFAWLRCRNSKAAFAGTFLILPVAMIEFTLRPQLIGYVFLLITLISLERFRQGEQKTLWVLPAIFLLWVNAHGSFTLGFMVLGIYWLSGLKEFSLGGLHSVRWRSAQRVHIELVCLLSVLALPLTPYGTRLAAVPFEVATSLPLNFADIVEWQPLKANYWEAKLLLVLLFAFIVAQTAFHFRYYLEEVALFLLAAYLTFVHFRFAILYAIIFAPLAASVLSRWAPAYDSKVDKYALNAILIFGALAAFAWCLPSEATLQKHISDQYPVQAVSYLQNHAFPERMFNEYFFGGYLVWTMAPKHRVFIDGRGDIFERAGVFSDYMDVIDLKPDALAVLQSYRIDSCLLYQNSPLATLLSGSPGWRQIYKDKLSAIFVRKGTDSHSGNAAPKSGTPDEAEQKGEVNTGI
ncbi:MAG: hypothetical protein M1423_05745 [Acidobacteria bacterium]|nr:hypothetical protein [Acidobacteriota bacterium]